MPLTILNCGLYFQSIAIPAMGPFRKEQFAKVKEKSAEMGFKREVCGENFC